ncbi:MAG: AmmeMemoRadiSam system protein B [Candidatus Schekmanbacteria bacterium]|nr:AmmeMemoRadiSam system protein B [Candidatus Schekmanbacteria bacterium]
MKPSTIRAAAVAGSFYPGTEPALIATLDALFAEAPHEPLVDALAVVSPHAGYRYSGLVAAKVYARAKPVRRYIILGPNHRGAGHPAAVVDEGAWETPLGQVPIDGDLAHALLSICPILAVDAFAHAWEHSLEVQVPFLQRTAVPFSILPIALFTRDFETCQELGRALAKVVADCPEDERPVLVASTDMTHYEADSTAREKDALARREIRKMNPEGLYRTVRNHRISMCGIIPTTTVLVACKELGADRAVDVGYQTSGDVTGDRSQVVGYAGFVVPKPSTEELGLPDAELE